MRSGSGLGRSFRSRRKQRLRESVQARGNSGRPSPPGQHPAPQATPLWMPKAPHAQLTPGPEPAPLRPDPSPLQPTQPWGQKAQKRESRPPWGDGARGSPDALPEAPPDSRGGLAKAARHPKRNRLLRRPRTADEGRHGRPPPVRVGRRRSHGHSPPDH